MISSLLFVLLAVSVALTISTHAFISAHGPKMGHCAKDSDCVPATCCHAGFCTSKSEGPKCDPKTDNCNHECALYSIDCGGYCTCDKTMGQCEAVYGNGTWVLQNGVQKRKKYAYYRAKVGSGYHKGRWH